MRNGEYLTSNANVAWPFDPDVPNLPPEVARAFADGGVIFGPKEPITEVLISRIDPTVGANDTVTALNFWVQKGGWLLKLSATLSTGEFTVVRNKSCFFVLDNQYARKITTRRFFYDTYKLDPAASVPPASSVTSINLINHRPDGSFEPEIRVTGDVAFVEGSNIGLLTTEDAKNPLSTSGSHTSVYLFAAETASEEVPGIVITAGAGLGTGKVPCEYTPICDDFSRGNISAAQDGSLVIEADDCYSVSVGYNQKGDQTVFLKGRCTACCQCEDYAATGNRLGEQATRALEIKKRLVSSSTAYNSAAIRYN